MGAFDPLDEREAQRVGADGILKKPFVPPDPLITMVKTLLDRTLGERLVAVAVSKPAAVVARQNRRSRNRGESVRPSGNQRRTCRLRKNFRPPVEPLSFGEGEHPVAFGNCWIHPLRIPPSPGRDVIEPVDRRANL